MRTPCPEYGTDLPLEELALFNTHRLSVLDAFTTQDSPVTSATNAPETSIFSLRDDSFGRIEFTTALPAKKDLRSTPDHKGERFHTADDVELSGRFGTTFSPNDPFLGSQWYHLFLGDMETVWDEYTGSGVAVAVYDDGVQYTHPDLAGNYDASKNVTIGGTVHDPLPLPAQPGEEDNGHGTSVAGIIAAVGDNNEGVTGVAFGASLTGVDIFGFGSPANINSNTTGFLEAADQLGTFDVVNHSWGSFPAFDPLFVAGDELTRSRFEQSSITGRGGLGTMNVQAAGNDDWNANGDWLMVSHHTIIVGAFDSGGNLFLATPGDPAAFSAFDVNAASDRSSYSNYGANLFVSAGSSGSSGNGDFDQPSTDLIGTEGYIVGDYLNTSNGFGGTSGATPVVTGVIALMLEANPGLGWRDVQNILAYSSTEIGSGIGNARIGDERHDWYYNGATNFNGGGLHFSEDYGFGAVNAFNAVRMAEVWSLLYDAQTSANEDYVAFDVQLPDGSVAIADAMSGGGTETTIAFTLPSDFQVEYAYLTLDITHTWLPDLSFDLVSPAGTISRLFANEGEEELADNGWQWVFGSNSFRGENVSGEWQLVITDSGVLDTGTLDGLQIEFYGVDQTTRDEPDDDVYHYTSEILEALADDPTRRTIEDTDDGDDTMNFAALTWDLTVGFNQNDFVRAVYTAADGSTQSFRIADYSTGTRIENVITGDGNDVVNGNGWDNSMAGMRGNDYLSGGGGDDDMLGGAGDDEMLGGSGNDEMEGNDGVDLMRGGSGNDTMRGGAGADTIFGNAGNDTIDGGTSGDFISAGSGVDVVEGGNGNDFISGGADADVLRGGAGKDEISGNGGSDRIFGGTEDDTLRGSGGADILLGEEGNDIVIGNSGVDVLYGNDGDDQLTGNTGNDRLFGGAGNDELRAGGQDDILLGEDGDDLLEGGGGDDILNGGAGTDALDGGSGADSLTGGADADGFNFIGNFGADRITDFTDDEDQLILSSSLFTGTITAQQFVDTYGATFGGNAGFDLGGGNTIVMVGYADLASLQALVDDIFIV